LFEEGKVESVGTTPKRRRRRRRRKLEIKI